jgi:sulfite reductase beta subunit-like hemoprotein
MACLAIATCGLAVAEAERILRALIRRIAARLIDRLGVRALAGAEA